MQFPPVQRALARQPRAIGPRLRFERPQRDAEQRIVAQALVVVELFIPQPYPKHALSEQHPDRVLD
jgi:hypothetical protein